MLLPNEYHSYFKIYIDDLASNGKSIIENLIETGNHLEQFATTISKEKELYVYAEGKWTFKQLLVHVIDTERIFNYRALRFARNDSTELQGFDHDFYNENVAANSQELQELIDEFKSVRASSISLFKSFSEEVLLRKGSASGNIISVRAIGFLISGHQKHHLKIFKERYF
ncbi:DinB family protein [Flavobacteriaceae bacterium]|jgi:hypothetical protein|nr:DinB family protein [Flavobacteriaceae bacterium]